MKCNTGVKWDKVKSYLEYDSILGSFCLAFRICFGRIED